MVRMVHVIVPTVGFLHDKNVTLGRDIFFELFMSVVRVGLFWQSG